MSNSTVDFKKFSSLADLSGKVFKIKNFVLSTREGQG